MSRPRRCAYESPRQSPGSENPRTTFSPAHRGAFFAPQSVRLAAQAARLGYFDCHLRTECDLECLCWDHTLSGYGFLYCISAEGCCRHCCSPPVKPLYVSEAHSHVPVLPG